MAKNKPNLLHLCKLYSTSRTISATQSAERSGYRKWMDELLYFYFSV